MKSLNLLDIQDALIALYAYLGSAYEVMITEIKPCNLGIVIKGDNGKNYIYDFTDCEIHVRKTWEKRA